MSDHEKKCFACDGSGIEATECPDYDFVDTECVVCNGSGTPVDSEQGGT